ncbi:MAG TPA: sulfotransferase [Candidatus Bathyarchaeia archaeon]|nr:sulfotransferase [Candidatus Bathyarchaeia archaeon]
MSAAIVAFNTVGRPLQRTGLPLFSLDDRVLLDEAVRRTGLSDYGGSEFQEPLRLLLQCLDRESHLTPLGRITARNDTLGLLENRLRLVEDRKRHPGIAEVAIRSPLFIVGLPRTGSTLLHHLLAQDPARRVAQAWEVMYPSPPPERARYEKDPRIAQAERQLRWLDRIVPDFKKIHPLGARLALECLAIMAGSFQSWRFNTMYRVPTYQEWLGHQDPGPAYQFHRRFLQHLAWSAPGERWVLKAPSHLHALETLFETYPDALVVQTHRDPVTVLASVASLTAVLRAGFSNRVDRVEIGRDVLQHWLKGIESAIRIRQAGRVPSHRFLDVHYLDLVADPIATVRGVYAHFGLTFTEETQGRIHGYFAERAKDRNGQHEYSLDTFALDPEEIAASFKGYRDHFGVRAEPAPGT